MIMGIDGREAAALPCRSSAIDRRCQLNSPEYGLRLETYHYRQRGCLDCQLSEDFLGSD